MLWKNGQLMQIQKGPKNVIGPKNDTQCCVPISFDCPVIRYGGSGIDVTIIIFWENITLRTVYYISVFNFVFVSVDSLH
jgi:hypothetical protein